MLVGSMFNDSLYWEQIYGKGKEIVRTMTNVDKKML